MELDRTPHTLAAWGLATLASALVLIWARELTTGWLVAAALSTLGALLAARRTLNVARSGASVALPMALLVLVVAVAAGTLCHGRFRAVERSYEELVETRERHVRAALERRMEVLVRRGRAAADQAAGRIRMASGQTVHSLSMLEDVRSRVDVSALAVYDSAGTLKTWAGAHRGKLPVQVRRGDVAVAYAERPLFSYLYFTAPVPGAEHLHTVSAVLLESGLESQQGREAFSARFAAATGAEARFHPGPALAAAWELRADGRTVVVGRIARPTQTDLRLETEGLARTLGALLGMAAFILLAFGWVRSPRGGLRWRSLAPLAVLTLVLPLVPLGPLLGVARYYEPFLFALPVPGDVTLGQLVAFLLPLAALVATLHPLGVKRRGLAPALGLGAVAVAGGYWFILQHLIDPATAELLRGGRGLWVGLHAAVILSLTALTALLLPRRRRHPAPALVRRSPALIPLLAVAGVALSIGLALLVMSTPAPPPEWPSWRVALWAFPYLLLGTAAAYSMSPRGTLLRWLAAGWLATSAGLPHLLNAETAARLETVEDELETLGARVDGYLEYLLTLFNQQVVERTAAGEEGVDLLYRSWVASGMARESYPARMALWDSLGVAEVELGLGGATGSDTAHAVLREAVDSAQRLMPGQYLVQAVVEAQDINYLLGVPLAGNRVATVVVPPRRELQIRSVVAPFLGGSPTGAHEFYLDTDLGGATEEVEWVRRERGWHGTRVVEFPDGFYRAHVVVHMPGTAVRVARGVLVLVADVALLVLLLGAGLFLRGMNAVSPRRVVPWLASFRGRITGALFLFFLTPTVVFGLVGYRALADEVERTTSAVAERAVHQAQLEFQEAGGDLRELARHAGTDVLLFDPTGELAQASSPEALELGVYGAWMPPEVWAPLYRSDEPMLVSERQLGGQSFIMAYRKLPPTNHYLAVPMMLSSGRTALMQRELADVVLFASLLGALLSLALSLAVGRALAGPIGRLRRAAAAVGGGRLRVRLPESRGDEFGQLYASFNRMVRRLRRARAQEVRTARVLAWGEMARQVAHEIKNPLTPIKLSVQHLRRARADRRPDFDRILDANVEQILREIDRLTEIARAFSRYGAPPEAAGPIEEVDAGAVVSEVLTLYRAGETVVRYTSTIEPDLPPVLARPGELKEVLLNLLENARAALGGQGRVALGVRRADGRVAIEVADDGPGIPPEILDRVFEPHFSTRSAGTGLGLAIVRRLVEGWGGEVTASSRDGRGTTVRLSLAAADEEEV